MSVGQGWGYTDGFTERKHVYGESGRKNTRFSRQIGHCCYWEPVRVGLGVCRRFRGGKFLSRGGSGAWGLLRAGRKGMMIRKEAGEVGAGEGADWAGRPRMWMLAEGWVMDRSPWHVVCCCGPGMWPLWALVSGSFQAPQSFVAAHAVSTLFPPGGQGR